MQTINPPTPAQLLASGQQPLVKVEIYVGAAWINLCDLGGKNYVKDFSISLGGASMTPDPIGGSWSVEIANENGIFHPQHPTSAYKDYLKTGRKTRISVGAIYGGVDFYWQRIIGYMDVPEFNASDYSVRISGGDYMKFLQDTEIRKFDNYWGTSKTFNSIASDGFAGVELYNEADAMDITGEADNVVNWTPTNCSFASVADGGGGSTYVGEIIATDISLRPDIQSGNLFIPEANTEYAFKFKYKKISGGGTMSISVEQLAVGIVGKIEHLEFHDAYEEKTVYFKTLGGVEVVKIYIELFDAEIGTKFRVDQFSISKFTPYWERYYELPAASTGPYYVTLDGDPVWQGEEDEGWYYEENTRRVFFDLNKDVDNGVNNLVVYYFTAESPENVVADILVKAGLYVNRVAALAAMEYTATGITIDRVWFEAGSKCLNAIKKLCERCDYRFHFKYDGIPVFDSKPAPLVTDFAFTEQKHIAEVKTFQDMNEIKNRITIEGEKQAEPVSKDETVPSELSGEEHDDTSIDEYGERTLTIKNHLFQDQASIDAMCVSLLAEYKDPKWYADIEVPFKPVPLELGDEISWKERLSPILEITQTGTIRDTKINNFKTIYKGEM